MSLAEALARSRRLGRSGFVPFLTAGDPSLEATRAFARTLASAGADLIEFGVPFSDPVADGPAIQASSQRALRAGASLPAILSLVRRLRREGFGVPVVLMTYLNPVLSLGFKRFARDCGRRGVSGVLVVDLPAEEWGSRAELLRRSRVEPVLLASPTTSDQRLRLVGRTSGSIVYYVSREGVTGKRPDLPPGLKARLRRVRSLTGKPLIVGFGIAARAQAHALAGIAEGVVVGSALVSAVARFPSVPAACRGLFRLSRRIAGGLAL